MKRIVTVLLMCLLVAGCGDTIPEQAKIYPPNPSDLAGEWVNDSRHMSLVWNDATVDEKITYDLVSPLLVELENSNVVAFPDWFLIPSSALPPTYIGVSCEDGCNQTGVCLRYGLNLPLCMVRSNKRVWMSVTTGWRFAPPPPVFRYEDYGDPDDWVGDNSWKIDTSLDFGADTDNGTVYWTYTTGPVSKSGDIKFYMNSAKSDIDLIAEGVVADVGSIVDIISTDSSFYGHVHVSKNAFELNYSITGDASLLTYFSNWQFEKTLDINTDTYNGDVSILYDVYLNAENQTVVDMLFLCYQPGIGYIGVAAGSVLAEDARMDFSGPSTLSGSVDFDDGIPIGTGIGVVGFHIPRTIVEGVLKIVPNSPSVLPFWKCGYPHFTITGSDVFYQQAQNEYQLGTCMDTDSGYSILLHHSWRQEDDMLHFEKHGKPDYVAPTHFELDGDTLSLAWRGEWTTFRRE